MIGRLITGAAGADDDDESVRATIDGGSNACFASSASFSCSAFLCDCEHSCVDCGTNRKSVLYSQCCKKDKDDRQVIMCI